MRSRESGFSLIEASAALGVAVVMFVILAQSLAVTVRLAHQNRLQQVATAVGVESVEFARSLSYDELVMTGTVPGDPNLKTSNTEVDKDAFDLQSDEDLVVDSVDPNALVVPEYTETIDDQLFTVRQYVTEIDPGLKRFIVQVSWFYNESWRSHHTSTAISELRR